MQQSVQRKHTGKKSPLSLASLVRFSSRATESKYGCPGDRSWLPPGIRTPLIFLKLQQDSNFGLRDQGLPIVSLTVQPAVRRVEDFCHG